VQRLRLTEPGAKSRINTDAFLYCECATGYERSCRAMTSHESRDRPRDLRRRSRGAPHERSITLSASLCKPFSIRATSHSVWCYSSIDLLVLHTLTWRRRTGCMHHQTPSSFDRLHRLLSGSASEPETDQRYICVNNSANAARYKCTVNIVVNFLFARATLSVELVSFGFFAFLSCFFSYNSSETWDFWLKLMFGLLY